VAKCLKKRDSWFASQFSREILESKSNICLKVALTLKIKHFLKQFFLPQCATTLGLYAAWYMLESSVKKSLSLSLLWNMLFRTTTLIAKCNKTISFQRFQSRDWIDRVTGNFITAFGKKWKLPPSRWHIFNTAFASEAYPALQESSMSSRSSERHFSKVSFTEQHTRFIRF